MNIFSKNNIFENKWINAFCDVLYKKVGVENLLICGGVSRCFLGENHSPKDLDLVTINSEAYNHVFENIAQWFPEQRITKSDKRIIIYTPFIAIEIWNGKEVHYQSKHQYKGVLPYIISSRMKKSNQNAKQ